MLWAEYLGAVVAPLTTGGGLTCLGTPGGNDLGCVGAGSGVGRLSDMIGRTVIDG